MKTRVINKQNAGNYTDEFIEQNKDKVVNGVLVSEWELVILYDGNFLKPIFENSEWIEGATAKEIKERAIEKETSEYQIRQQKGMNLYLRKEAEFRLLYLDGEITKGDLNNIEFAILDVRLELGFGQIKSAKDKLLQIAPERIGNEIFNQFENDLNELINELY